MDDVKDLVAEEIYKAKIASANCFGDYTAKAIHDHYRRVLSQILEEIRRREKCL